MKTLGHDEVDSGEDMKDDESNNGLISDSNSVDEEDAIGDMFEGLNAKRDVWRNSANRVLKNEIIRELIWCFGGMINSTPKQYAVPDCSGKYRFEDLEHSKLLHASKCVVRAKNSLLQNENFDTREFTLYIARKKWVHSILAPLIGLCSGTDGSTGDDLGLAMRCCGLAIVLIKRLSDSTLKVLEAASGLGSIRKGGRRKSSKEGDSTSKKDRKKNDEEENDDEASADERPTDTIELVNKADRLAMIVNAKEQVSALLSFKDAFSQCNANTAISNAFRVFWLQEQQVQQQVAMREGFNSEENKQGVAICFSYARRLLAIQPLPHVCSEGERIGCQLAHYRCISQLSCVLSVLPGVCGDLLRSYHDDWLSDVLLIIFYCIRDMAVKDLFDIWKSGAIADSLDDYQDGRKGTKILLPAAVPHVQAGVLKSSLKVTVQDSTKGLLSSRLRTEGLQRQAVLAKHSGSACPRAGNLTGVYTLTRPRPPSGGQTDAPPPPSRQYLTCAFQNPSDCLPQAKERRSKAKLTFSTLTQPLASHSQKALLSAVGGTDGLLEQRRAQVVVASLVNLLSQDFALKPLVKRVNEDLRRDELRVGPDLELRYFELLSVLLSFNRLKLRHLQSQQVAAHKQSGHEEASFQWQPDLVNVMDALDRMSFRRVTAAIERNLKRKTASGHADILPAMTLFKEMVSYLRILLESGLEGHHEIAVAALYRLFYASSDRLDPLPRLLGDWRPGLFSREHADKLAELLHETMKTLDAAREMVRALLGQELDDEDEQEIRKRLQQLKKGKGKGREMGMELYVTSCLRFNVDEYFRRLSSNHTVCMYTKLLANCRSNSSLANHHIFSFLRRMCTYNLEQHFHAPPPVPSAAAAAGVDTGTDGQLKVHLGYMLYNVHTMGVISGLLSDRAAQKEKALEPLLRLLRSIVRGFAAAACRNQLLFVEALFQHPRPAEHCCLLDNIYEASSYMPSLLGDRRTEAGKRKESNSDSDSDSDNEPGRTEQERALPADIFNTTNGRVALQEEDEFDFDNELNVSRSTATGATSSAALSSPDGEGAEGEGEREGDEEEAARRRRQRLKQAAERAGSGQREGGRERQRRAARWSAEEDAVLRRLYSLYAGTNSLLTAIAQSDELAAVSLPVCGQQRSAAQVANRVKQLQLQTEFSRDGDGEGDSDKELDRRKEARDKGKKRERQRDKKRTSKDRRTEKGGSAAETDQEQETPPELAYSQEAMRTLSKLDLMDLDRQMDLSSSSSSSESEREPVDERNSKRRKAEAPTVARRLSLTKTKSISKRASVSEDEDDLLLEDPVSVSVSVGQGDSEGGGALGNRDLADQSPTQQGAVNSRQEERAKKMRKAMIMLSDSDDE